MAQISGEMLFRKVIQFYEGAFAVIAVFSIAFSFYKPFFSILALASTALVIFYSFMYKSQPRFKLSNKTEKLNYPKVL